MKKVFITTILTFLFILGLSGAAWAESVTVIWNPNIESDLDGYKLYYGVSSPSSSSLEVYNNSVDVGNVVLYQLLLPDDGFTYYLALTAYDTSGNESGYSNEINHTTTDLIPPGVPTLLQILEQISKTLRNIETILREIKSTPS